MSVLELEPKTKLPAWGEDKSGAYWEDFAAWAMAQAELIRSGQVSKLDLVNVAEELDSLGRSQHQALESRLEVLIAHLLKWRYQPRRRSKSWRVTIDEQRRQADRLLAMSPSMKSSISEYYVAAYQLARSSASREALIAIERFPTEPPFTLEQARDPDFFPEAVERR